MNELGMFLMRSSVKSLALITSTWGKTATLFPLRHLPRRLGTNYLPIARSYCSAIESGGEVGPSVFPGGSGLLTQKDEGTHVGVRQEPPEEDVFGTLVDADDEVGRRTHHVTGKKSKRRRQWEARDASSALAASTFGSLAKAELEKEFRDERLHQRSFEDDEGEVDESEQPYRRLDSEGRRHTPDWYGRQIEKLSKAGKTREAVEMFETTMLKEDRVRPNVYVFSTLIGVLGRVGYTKKAFRLAKKMKDMGLRPVDHTYTALFNACSNSPWKEDGLRRAGNLREQMRLDGWQPNLITYKAMIKAYAWCGDFQTAFAVADEVQGQRLSTDPEVFSFLLMACVADREAGLRHAVQVWRLMARRKITPVVQHYNLLLKIVRECGLGDHTLAQELLHRPPLTRKLNPKQPTGVPPADVPSRGSKTSAQPLMIRPELLGDSHGRDTDGAVVRRGSSSDDSSTRAWWQFDSDSDSAVMVPVATTLEASDSSTVGVTVPNILDPFDDVCEVVSLAEVRTPQDKLALLGGVPGILQRMKRDQIQPDLKTFTQLLTVLPPSRQAEDDLMSIMARYKITPDTDILNTLIRVRNKRKDHKGALLVLEQMPRYGCSPNPTTYKSLAVGCPRKTDGLRLLQNMDEAGLRPAEDLFRTLMARAYLDFSYKAELLLAMRRLEVRPSSALLEKLDESVIQARRALVDAEKGRDVPKFIRSRYFREGFRTFMLQYKSWLVDMKVDIPPHPWEQYNAAPSVSSVDPDADTACPVKLVN